MTVDDHVAQCIATYPTLFLLGTYEASKIKVLEQAFIVLGNGYEWAYTKDPTKGGYLIEPKSKKVKGEWVRKYDEPYGKVKFHGNIQDYFTNPVYKITSVEASRDDFRRLIVNNELSNDEYIKKRTELHHNRLLLKKRISENKPAWLRRYSSSYVYVVGDEELEEIKFHYKNMGIEVEGELASRRQLCWDNQGSPKPYHPYPNFQKTYSCFWEEEVKYIQEDWRLAAIEHLEHWLSYWNTDLWKENTSRYKDNHSAGKQEQQEAIVFLEKTISKLQTCK